jgi:hypothetical protein
MLLAQRDSATEETKFHWVATDSGACMLDFGALHQAKHHEALNLWVRGINRPDDAFLATFQSS